MKYIPKIESELEFSFSRSSGAGGQNINKVNTKATMKWDIEKNVTLNDHHKKRFKLKYTQYYFDGVIIIRSQRYRTQKQNSQDCLLKLDQMLMQTARAPLRRKMTKPSKGAIEKRLQSKKINSLKKRLRSEKY